MPEINEIKSDRRKEDVLRHIAEDFLKDRRSQRRLAYIKTGFFLAFFVFIMSVNVGGFNPFSQSVSVPQGEGYVAMVRVTGQISPGSPASAEILEKQMARAFADDGAAGVLLVVNSPGGTAVQGLMLKNMIEEFKTEYSKKVVVFGEDILASGAYMASMAADSIYVTPSTITGSIGVIQQHFGASELMNKLGVDARTIYSGEHKNRMSMYAPLDKDDENKISDTTRKIHEHFISLVKSSRGDRLVGDEHIIFSGDSWVGTDAFSMGLVDGVSSLSHAIETEFGAKHKVDYTERSPVNGLRKIMSVANVLQTNFSPDLPWESSLPK
jgi:protease-4